MIIKKLKLQNIRSYKEATIDIPLGKTLFEGDIGSGKSTLLMAIEFALFGLGSESGVSLLKAGEAEGRIGLIFEVDGREYSVIRTLVRKGAKVQQKAGELRTPEGIMHLSPTELKESILEILGFNEPFDPKARSVIYEYAVYTPQEQMKTLLFMPLDSRLQTLRKIFRLEDYKIAKENASELSKKLQNKIEVFEDRSSDLQSLRERVAQERSRLEVEKKELDTLKSSEQKREARLQSHKMEKEKLRADEQRLKVTLNEISLLENFLQSSKSEIQGLTNDIESLENRITVLQKQISEIKAVKDPIPKSQDEIKKELAELEQHSEELKRIEAKADVKIEDYRIVQDTGSCPTCDREASPDEFVGKIRLKEIEKEDLVKKIAKHKAVIDNCKRLLEEKRQYGMMQERLTDHNDELVRYNYELNEKKERIDKTRVRYETSARKLEESRRIVEVLEGTSTKIRELEVKISDIEGDLIKIRADIAINNANIHNLNHRIKEYEDELGKKEELKSRAEMLKEYHIWINDYFVPVLDLVERQVLININQDFNSNFQNWFSALVEDSNKEARVDENFTPVVEQDSYEQDIRYLSGGEKTSLALAYRLALNNAVQKVSTGMKSNLMVFDEPTDGFSKEQLSKVREILDEIQSSQIIMVSHEKELESFADQIFRIVKVQGESKISAGTI
jgi:exonuclease SbcC